MTHARKLNTADRTISVQPPSEPKLAAEPTGNGRDRATMIAEAAYYLAEKRSFSPGSELDDWLAAERQVDLKPSIESSASA